MSPPPRDESPSAPPWERRRRKACVTFATAGRCASRFRKALAACMAARCARTAAHRSGFPLRGVGGRGLSVPLDVERPGPSLVPLAPSANILASSASESLIEALERQERAVLLIGAASTASVSLPWPTPRGVIRCSGAGSADGAR